MTPQAYKYDVNEGLMNNKRTKARCIKWSMRWERGQKSLLDGARLKQNRQEMGEIWWKEHMVWLSFIFTGRIKCARRQTVNTSRISLERAFRWSYIEGNPQKWLRYDQIFTHLVPRPYPGFQSCSHYSPTILMQVISKTKHPKCLNDAAELYQGQGVDLCISTGMSAIAG